MTKCKECDKGFCKDDDGSIVECSCCDGGWEDCDTCADSEEEDFLTDWTGMTKDERDWL